MGSETVSRHIISPDRFRKPSRPPTMAEIELAQLRSRSYIEERVRYAPQTTDGYDQPNTYDGDTEDAADYSWLMKNHIVWVEQRIAYKPEPWYQQ